MLTNDQMRAAHFTRQLDQDPDLGQFKGSDKARAIAHESGRDAGELETLYAKGREVLRGWTLSYSPRFVRGTAWPQHEAECVLLVDAGHIAASEAARLALFRHRPLGGSPNSLSVLGTIYEHGTWKALASKLYNSRQHGWYIDHDGYRRYGTLGWQSELVDLVQEIYDKATARGLTLSRWETSSTRSGWLKTITWAVHEGPRPDRSDRLPEGAHKVVLHQTEGKSKRCTAYRELSKLLAAF